MCNLDEFFATYPLTRRLRAFDAQDLEQLATYKLPADIQEFLKTEGLATYYEDFWWTTLPQYHFQTFSEWGLHGKSCYAFLRTALGGLLYYSKGKINRLDPYSGSVVKYNLDFCTYMNGLLTIDTSLEATYFDVYKKGRTAQLLEYDEIFALVPALPLGGSLETSRLEVVKMHEHLAFLAQLFGNKVRNV